MNSQPYRIALVHDYLNQMGGAERVLEVLHEVFRTAPIYTSIYSPRLVAASFQRMDVRTSFMQRLPLVARHHQPFLPLYPLAFEQFDLSGYDVVLSMSSAWAKGVVTRPETCHVCYCLTPMRWAWTPWEYTAAERINPLARCLLPLVLSWLRMWDMASAQRVDFFATTSQAVAQRIRKYYRREPAIIHPPVNTRRFEPSPAGHDDYFLIVSRLVPYKRIDLAVEAFNRLRLPLRIIGGGRDAARLRSLAGPTVELLGPQPDAEIRRHFQRCRAFLFPGEEDFGITPLEAQAAGRPVIAFGGGGALETVREGETGLFFNEPTPDSLAAAVETFLRLPPTHFRPESVARHAATFDTEVFKERIRRHVEESWEQHGGRRGARRRGQALLDAARQRAEPGAPTGTGPALEIPESGSTAAATVATDGSEN